jgi:hypothetical protein
MRVALTLVAVLVLAGCGGGGEESSDEGTVRKPRPAYGGPKPAETAEDAAARVGKAARADDCRSAGDILYGPGATETCRKLLPHLEPAPNPAVKTYGSGAVVQNADGGTTILVLDRDRRFKVGFSFVGPPRAHLPLRVADEAMARTVGAVRRDNCDDIQRYSVRYTNIDREKSCGRPSLRALHRALDRNYTAEPTRLGGDGAHAFYGLSVEGEYFTLLFLATGGGYAFVESYRASTSGR